MRSGLRWLCMLIIFLISGSHMFALAQGSATDSCTIAEILVVPFNKYGGITTSASYSGVVELIIVGYGDPVPGDGWSEDAFYAFWTNDPSHFTRPAWGLRLSRTGCSCMTECGAPMISTFIVGQIPQYSAEHIYRITINVGSNPAKLTFGNGDCGVWDNTGFYVIIILRCNTP